MSLLFPTTNDNFSHEEANMLCVQVVNSLSARDLSFFDTHRNADCDMYSMMLYRKKYILVMKDQSPVDM